MISLSFFVKNKNKNKKYKISAQRGEDLLLALDIFVKKHNIDILDIQKFKLDTSSREISITSQRIAQAILQAIKIGKEWR